MVMKFFGLPSLPPHSGQFILCFAIVSANFRRVSFSVSVSVIPVCSWSRWSARSFFLHFRHSTMGSRKDFTCPEASKTLAGVMIEDSISRMLRGLVKKLRNFSSILCLRVAPNGP